MAVSALPSHYDMSKLMARACASIAGDRYSPPLSTGYPKRWWKLECKYNNGRQSPSLLILTHLSSPSTLLPSFPSHLPHPSMCFPMSRSHASSEDSWSQGFVVFFSLFSSAFFFHSTPLQSQVASTQQCLNDPTNKWQTAMARKLQFPTTCEFCGGTVVVPGQQQKSAHKGLTHSTFPGSVQPDAS